MGCLAHILYIGLFICPLESCSWKMEMLSNTKRIEELQRATRQEGKAGPETVQCRATAGIRGQDLEGSEQLPHKWGHLASPRVSTFAHMSSTIPGTRIIRVMRRLGK